MTQESEIAVLKKAKQEAEYALEKLEDFYPNSKRLQRRLPKLRSLLRGFIDTIRIDIQDAEKGDTLNG